MNAITEYSALTTCDIFFAASGQVSSEWRGEQLAQRLVLIAKSIHLSRLERPDVAELMPWGIAMS
jgi:hypothetical protein